MTKFFVYLLSTIIVLFAMDGVNINAIFKKNKIIQARVFYLVLSFSLIYLLTSFLYDFLYIKFF